MNAILIKDAPILIPNAKHKNFTETKDILKKGTEVKGEAAIVKGLRRGKAFDYKVFTTDNKQIIYLNTINPMQKTEVTLGADSAQSATVVSLPPTAANDKTKLYGAIVGGLAGFAYCKYKKHDIKKMAMFIALGAVAGYGVGVILVRRKNVIVKPSK